MSKRFVRSLHLAPFQLSAFMTIKTQPIDYHRPVVVARLWLTIWAQREHVGRLETNKSSIRCLQVGGNRNHFYPRHRRPHSTHTGGGPPIHMRTVHQTSTQRLNNILSQVGKPRPANIYNFFYSFNDIDRRYHTNIIVNGLNHHTFVSI